MTGGDKEGAVDLLVLLMKGLAELLGAGAQPGLAAPHCPGPPPEAPTYRSESVLMLFVEGTAAPIAFFRRQAEFLYLTLDLLCARGLWVVPEGTMSHLGQICTCRC